MEEGNRARQTTAESRAFQTLSNSGAILEIRGDKVYKTGGFQNLVQEANMVAYLGREVCPAFVDWLPAGYIMERCEPIEPAATDADAKSYLTQIHRILQRVWERPLLHETPNWTQLNWASLKETPIPSQYATWAYENPGRICLTHGDPTMANLLLRGKQALLCDPIYARAAYPSVRPLDYGKMLQSAAGWEHQLDPKWYSGGADLAIWVMDQIIPKEEALTSTFWAAYHCARISVSSTNKGTKRGRWALEASLMFVALMQNHLYKG